MKIELLTKMITGKERYFIGATPNEIFSKYEVWKNKVSISIISTLVGFSTQVNADNLCATGLLQKKTDASHTSFQLREFPEVIFETTSECKYIATCNYKISLFGDPNYHVIRGEIDINDICNSFSRSVSVSDNPLFENDVSDFGQFEFILSTLYIFENSFGWLNLEIEKYHHGGSNSVWGSWDGDSGGGQIFSSRINSYKIITGWKK